MYHYIYHRSLHDNKHLKKVLGFENRINAMGMRGKITRLGNYSVLEETIKKDSEANKTSTLVVVGDDELFSRTLSALEPLYQKPTVGYIPFFGNTAMSISMGIPCDNEGAVLTLAKRRTENLRPIKINDGFFVCSAVVFSDNAQITINESYKITTASGFSETMILNLPQSFFSSLINSNINPSDSRVEVLVSCKKNEGIFKLNKKNQTIDGFFFGETVTVTTDSVSDVLVDGFYKIKTPITVNTDTNPISVIVGKDRLFN